MIYRIWKSFASASLNNSSVFQKSPISCSISLLYFSSESGKLNPDIALADCLINQHQFSPEAAQKASFSAECVKNPKKYDYIISFLKESGFSKTHIEELVKKKPNILASSVEKTIKPKFKIFRDLGFSRNDIVEIISGDPWILFRSADNRVVPSIAALRTVLGSDVGVSKALKISTWFLKLDLESTMIPNVELMKSRGTSSSQINKYVFSFPRLFLRSPEKFQALVKRVDELGFDRSSKMYLSAIRTLSSMSVENWELKLELFRSLGFSEDDILCVFRKAPQVFAVSERKIKAVSDFLCSKAKVDNSVLIKYPNLLLCSLERRLKPRLRIIQILKSKNLIRKTTSMIHVCRMTESEFRVKYVIPYVNELAEMSVDYDFGVIE